MNLARLEVNEEHLAAFLVSRLPMLEEALKRNPQNLRLRSWISRGPEREAAMQAEGALDAGSALLHDLLLPDGASTVGSSAGAGEEEATDSQHPLPTCISVNATGSSVAVS
jgi:hypothetical protein